MNFFLCARLLVISDHFFEQNAVLVNWSECFPFYFIISRRLDWQAKALCYQPVRSFVRSSVRPFVRLLPTCEHNILKTNEPTVSSTSTATERWLPVAVDVMPIRTNGPRGNGMKWSTFGSYKVKGLQIRNRSQDSLLARYIKKYPTNFNQTWQAHITVIGNCVTELGCKMSKVKVTRGRRQIWRPGGGIISDPFGSSSFKRHNLVNIQFIYMKISGTMPRECWVCKYENNLCFG